MAQLRLKSSLSSWCGGQETPQGFLTKLEAIIAATQGKETKKGPVIEFSKPIMENFQKSFEKVCNIEENTAVVSDGTSASLKGMLVEKLLAVASLIFPPSKPSASSLSTSSSSVFKSSAEFFSGAFLKTLDQVLHQQFKSLHVNKDTYGSIIETLKRIFDHYEYDASESFKRFLLTLSRSLITSGSSESEIQHLLFKQQKNNELLVSLMTRLGREDRSEIARMSAFQDVTKELLQQLYNIGDYFLQLDVLESILLLTIKKQREELIKGLWPEDSTIHQLFMQVSGNQFESSAPYFLVYMNSLVGLSQKKVFCVSCQEISKDGSLLKFPEELSDESGMCLVAFNKSSKSISFSVNSDDASYEQFIVEDDMIQEYMLSDSDCRLTLKSRVGAEVLSHIAWQLLSFKFTCPVTAMVDFTFTRTKNLHPRPRVATAIFPIRVADFQEQVQSDFKSDLTNQQTDLAPRSSSTIPQNSKSFETPVPHVRTSELKEQQPANSRMMMIANAPLQASSPVNQRVLPTPARSSGRNKQILAGSAGRDSKRYPSLEIVSTPLVKKTGSNDVTAAAPAMSPPRLKHKRDHYQQQYKPSIPKPFIRSKRLEFEDDKDFENEGKEPDEHNPTGVYDTVEPTPKQPKHMFVDIKKPRSLQQRKKEEEDVQEPSNSSLDSQQEQQIKEEQKKQRRQKLNLKKRSKDQPEKQKALLRAASSSSSSSSSTSELPLKNPEPIQSKSPKSITEKKTKDPKPRKHAPTSSTSVLNVDSNSNKCDPEQPPIKKSHHPLQESDKTLQQDPASRTKNTDTAKYPREGGLKRKLNEEGASGLPEKNNHTKGAHHKRFKATPLPEIDVQPFVPDDRPLTSSLNNRTALDKHLTSLREFASSPFGDDKASFESNAIDSRQSSSHYHAAKHSNPHRTGKSGRSQAERMQGSGDEFMLGFPDSLPFYPLMVDSRERTEKIEKMCMSFLNQQISVWQRWMDGARLQQEQLAQNYQAQVEKVMNAIDRDETEHSQARKECDETLQIDTRYMLSAYSSALQKSQQLGDLVEQQKLQRESFGSMSSQIRAVDAALRSTAKHFIESMSKEVGADNERKQEMKRQKALMQLFSMTM